MTVLHFTAIVLFSSFIAGFAGSLTGLGGGVIIIPMLTLVFHIDIRYAIGASLISVIATSSGAAAAYVKDGITNIRLGMFLEIATTIGAVIGATLAIYTSTHVIEFLFGVILLASAFLSLKDHSQQNNSPGTSRIAKVLKLQSEFRSSEGLVSYAPVRIPGGFLMMAVAGVVSGLLGIGSGALKVLAMDTIMKLPFKVSTATSNFMIGVTAGASAGVYLLRGYIDPQISMAVVLGVLIGALIGSRLLIKARTKLLRSVFAILIVFLAAQMIYKAFN